MRASPLFPLMMLLACQPAPRPASTPTPSDEPPPRSDLVSVATPPLDLAEQVPGASLYDDGRIHEIALSLGSTAKRALRTDPYEWVEGSVSLDGTDLVGVGVRLRGKIGSFREIDEKPKFKLDLDRFNEGQRYEGLDTLALNNEVVDCSYLKEMAGYAAFRAMGIAAPRTAYAHVTVDDEDYGLYLLVEYPNEDFLQDNFDDPSGNLYDGKYGWDGEDTYWLADFTPDLQDNFELEEGTDVGHEDVHAVTDALGDRGALDERLAGLVNLDQLHTFVVGEQWIGHIDGYSLNINNYRVYFDPQDGAAKWVPWDLDYAFITAIQWGMSWKNPAGAVVDACWDDEDCLEAHRARVAELVEDFDGDALIDQIDQWSALIDDAAHDDPRRECRASSIDGAQDDIREWIDERPADMIDKWDL